MSAHIGLPAGLVVVALCLTLCLCTTAVGGLRVALVSDIHYDPLYGTPKAFHCTKPSDPVWGLPGCDASPQLTARTLDDVSAQNTSLILYVGDWQRHNYKASGLAPAALFRDLSERFRHVSVDGSLGPIAFSTSLGNNDVDPDYYFAWEEEESKMELSQRVEAMKEVGLLDNAEAYMMRKCGYYTHKMLGVRVIVLNTLLWAYTLKPPLPPDVSDPCNQFLFLRRELAEVRAARERAIIMGHIPPGLSLNDVLSRGFKSVADDMFWKEQYEETYDSIIYEYKDHIATQLFGHTHRFRLLTVPRNGVLSLIVPAVSPIFHNHPSYLVANVTDAWSLEDTLIRYMTDGGVFHSGYSARTALGLTNGLQFFAEVQEAITRLARDDAMWEHFLTMYCGGKKLLDVFPKGNCDEHCRYVVVCSMLENDHTKIQRCVDEYEAQIVPPQDGQTSGCVVAVIVMFSLLVVAACMVLLLMTRSGQMTISLERVTTAAWWRSLLVKRKNTAIVEGNWAVDVLHPH